MRVEPLTCRALSLLATVAIFSNVVATDWPRFRGPDLCAHSPDPSLTLWPTNGLELIWRVPSPVSLGGYASFAVSGGKAYTLRNLVTNGLTREFCVALDAVTGEQVWATQLALQVAYAYSTPSVEAGKAYAYGGELKLYCLDAEDGSVLWQRNMISEFGSMSAQNSQSPCVEDGRVFVSIAAPTNCLLAFNATNGALIWRGHTNALTYGSPVAVTVHGIRQIVFPDRSGLVSVDPETGRMLWRHGSGSSYDQGSSPFVHGDTGVWVPTHAEGGEAFRIVYSNDVFSTITLWTNRTLRGTFVTLVAHQEHLYGIFGGSLECVELNTGQSKWRTNAVNNGSLILVDGRLVCLTETGRLVLAKASPLGYEEISRFVPFVGAGGSIACMNSAAAVDGRIYAANPKELLCLDASIPAPLQVSSLILPGNLLCIVVSSTNGSPIATGRIPQVGLRWTSDLRQTPDAWPPLPAPLVFTNGTLRCIQPISATGAPRFYMAVEQSR